MFQKLIFVALVVCLCNAEVFFQTQKPSSVVDAQNSLYRVFKNFGRYDKTIDDTATLLASAFEYYINTDKNLLGKSEFLEYIKNAKDRSYQLNSLITTLSVDNYSAYITGKFVEFYTDKDKVVNTRIGDFTAIVTYEGQDDIGQWKLKNYVEIGM